jgi:hypothetical protein
MIQIIDNNINQIRQLFKFHKIERAYIFGSSVTENFNENSDLDFLVKFQTGLDPLEKGELWWNLHDKLREIFKREIDIVTESSLKNPYFIQELEETKVLIYGD